MRCQTWPNPAARAHGAAPALSRETFGIIAHHEQFGQPASAMGESETHGTYSLHLEIRRALLGSIHRNCVVAGDVVCHGPDWQFIVIPDPSFGFIPRRWLFLGKVRLAKVREDLHSQAAADGRLTGISTKCGKASRP